jgi:hypothetical protein
VRREGWRWTSLNRALRDMADEGGGFIDLRPGGADEDRLLRRLKLGRTAKLKNGSAWLNRLDQRPLDAPVDRVATGALDVAAAGVLRSPAQRRPLADSSQLSAPG